MIDVTEFVIVLCLKDGVWKARCASPVSAPLVGEAAGQTPAQALSSIARVINRYRFQHARRPASREISDPIRPHISTSSDGG